MLKNTHLLCQIPILQFLYFVIIVLAGGLGSLAWKLRDLRVQTVTFLHLLNNPGSLLSATRPSGVFQSLLNVFQYSDFEDFSTPVSLILSWELYIWLSGGTEIDQAKEGSGDRTGQHSGRLGWDTFVSKTNSQETKTLLSISLKAWLQILPSGLSCATG